MTATLALNDDQSSLTFKDFTLEPALAAALAAMKFETPTPIQAMAIPFALEGRDILGSAQTGTGKTGAFCVPMINFLLKNPQAHALVMLPTRELASQVHVVARQMIGEQVKGPSGIKTALLIGGEPIAKQYAQLERRPRLIVGTPGRINDHLRSNPDLVDRVGFVVLDEADRMLDMGFAPQIDSILSETALERQTLMFSATFPDNIVKFSKQYLQNPERVSAGVQSKPGENIEQESLNVAQERKYDELMLQLQKREGSVIIFVRTQHGADKLAVKLNKDEYASEAIHGGLRQRQREKVIRMFRKGEIRILVATDVAARGLDVPHIEHVVNYDLPQVAEDYVHRIGRTARAGAKGQAVSFISPGEKHLWRDIERMLNPEAANSDFREGGRGGPRKGGKFGGGKKFGGGGKPFGKKPFEKRDGEGERDYGPKKDGGFKARKPFGRADRKERRENGWNPDGDFRGNSEERVEGAFNPRPRREFQGERPQRGERSDSYRGNRDGGGYQGSRAPRSENYQGGRDGGFKKPFKKREDGDFASNPDAYKRTSSAERKEGGFKKPFQKKFFNESGEGRRSEGGFRKPFRQGERSEGGQDRPYKKPFNRDGNSADRPRGDRPFRQDGERRSERSEGGFKKPYRAGGNDRPNGGSAGDKRPARNGGRPNNDRPQGDRPRSAKSDGGRHLHRKDGAQRSR